MRMIIAANTASQLLGKIIGAGVTLVISILLAKKFGVVGYGDYVKVTTFVSFFFLIADFGFNAVYIQKNKESWTLPALAGTRLVGGILLIFIALALLAFLPHSDSRGYTNAVRLGIILFSPAILFQAAITTTNAIFQKHLRYDLATVAMAIGGVVSLGVLFVMLRLPVSSSVSGPFAVLAGSIATAAVAVFFVKHLEKTLTITISFTSMSRLFWLSLPLGLTLLFNLVYGHVDSIILTLTRSTAEVGVYGFAYKIFEVALVLPTFFMNAVYPMMMKEISNKKQGISETFIRILKKSFLFLLLLSSLFSLLSWFAAPYITLVQEGFIASVPALRILSLSLPFFFVSALTMWSLIALGKQYLLVFIYGGAMIINIFLNAWLIPLFGYMAAAWITVVSEGMVLAVSAAVLVRILSKRKIEA